MDPNIAKTTCENCVFATFADEQWEPFETPIRTQTGCRLGRLDKFHERGVPIELRQTQDGRLAALIGRVCMAARKSPWGDGMSPEVQEAKVRKEMRFACHVYILALNATPEEIERTLESLIVQKPQPIVAEVLLQGRTRPGPLIRRFNENFAGRIQWVLTVINTDETTDSQAIDSAVARCRSPFYAIFHAGVQAPADFLANLDKAVNEELLTFSIVPGDVSDNGLVVLTQMHHRMGGNETVDMVEGDPEEMTDEELEKTSRTSITGLLNKVRFLAEVCGVAGLIKEGHELCQTES